MKNLKIKYRINISKDVKTANLIEIFDDSILLDICRITGVFIDNAIQAVTDLKDKYLDIDMYKDDNFLVIAISNNYIGNIELDRLDERGYTTKSKGHGYGLSLVKEIINKNNRLKNERKLSKNIFTQILKIKM